MLKFLEHFAQIRQAMDTLGVWDDADGFYYDKLVTPDGTAVPVKVRSMVGVIPLLAAVVVDERGAGARQGAGEGVRPAAGPAGRPGAPGRAAACSAASPGTGGCSWASSGSSTSPGCWPRCWTSASSCRRTACGPCPPSIATTPTSSRSTASGPRSTTSRPSRPPPCSAATPTGAGPIWFPLNYLLISALERYHRFFGDELTVEYPTGGPRVTLDRVAADLRQRLIDLFLVGPDGRRPCFGGVDRLQRDPAWSGNLVFNEYFHGDNGAGLGASHQTGWTGLVADLIRGRPGDGVYAIADLVRVVDERSRP